MPEPSGAPSGAPTVAWWRRRSPSTFTLVGVIATMLIAGLLVSRSVGDVLDDVPKDRLGTDPWTATLGVEGSDPYQLAHLPDCAAGSVTRLALWDEDSNPYWEVSGPPTPVETFFVGGTPAGFTVDQPYTAPPAGAILRLVAFRRAGDPIGLRYRAVDVVEGRVIATPSLTRFSRDGFRTAEVCGDAEDPAEAEAEAEG